MSEGSPPVEFCWRVWAASSNFNRSRPALTNRPTDPPRHRDGDGQQSKQELERRGYRIRGWHYVIRLATQGQKMSPMIKGVQTPPLTRDPSKRHLEACPTMDPSL